MKWRGLTMAGNGEAVTVQTFDQFGRACEARHDQIDFALRRGNEKMDALSGQVTKVSNDLANLSGRLSGTFTVLLVLAAGGGIVSAVVQVVRLFAGK